LVKTAEEKMLDFGSARGVRAKISVVGPGHYSRVRKGRGGLELSKR